MESEICLYIQISFESLDVRHFKYKAIKLALIWHFLTKNFETTFIQKVAATVRFGENWIFFFLPFWKY